MKVFVQSVFKKFCYLIAASILLVATMVLTGRMLTPVLNQNLPDIEHWASNLLQTPVTIDKADVSWYKYQPGIRLKSVNILNKDSSSPLLQLQAIRIFFSLPKSLWQRKLVPSGIMVSGTSIDLHQTANGEITLKDFSPLSGIDAQKETKFTDVMGFLSSQPHLILRDVNIHFAGFKGQKRFITLYNLSFRNQNDEHVIDGQAVLHQEIPTELTVAIKWKGESYDPAKLRSKFYLYASGLSLKQWMKDAHWNSWSVNRGLVSAKVWGTWQEGHFNKLQTLFQVYGLELYSQKEKKTHVINRVSGNVGLKRKGDEYILAGEDILIDLQSHLWPATQFYLSLIQRPDGIFTPKVLNIGYLSLTDTQTFLLPSTTWLSDDIKQKLSALHLKGSLENLHILFASDWQDWRKLTGSTQFQHISFNPTAQIPGIENLTGKLQWDGQKADVEVNSMQTNFRYVSFFPQVQHFNQVLGNLQWQIDANNAWLLSLPSLTMQNDELNLQVSGKLAAQNQALPIADMVVHFNLQNASHISQYLPTKLFDEYFVQWMKDAFLAGELTNGEAIIKGPLSEFPFDQKNGLFSVTGKVSNVHLHYAPLWPDMQHIYGKIAFINRKMIIDVDKAEMLHIPIEAVHGELPDIGGQSDQVLTVQSNKIQTDFPTGLNFIHQSPLKDTVGKMFANMQMTGNINLKLGLTVPLGKPENTKVLGDLHFDDAQMKLPAWNLNLNKLKGDLRFTEATTFSERITGELFNKPIVFDLSSVQKSKDINIIRAHMKSRLQTLDLENWLQIPFSKVVQGETDIETDIDMSLTAPMEVHLKSDLIGVAVNLPDQYAKNVNEGRNFAADIIIAEEKPLHIKLHYGDLVNAALVLTQNNHKFNLISANLHLGKGEADWAKKEGLYITGHFKNLDWEQIKKYISQYNDKETSTLALREIEVEADKIDLGAQQLKDVKVNVTPHKDTWEIAIDSPNIIGDIEAPKVMSKQGLIYARFQELKLSSLDEKNSATSSLNAATWPAIHFVADHVNYNDIALGQVAFKTVNAKDGLTINSLHVESSRLFLEAEGKWSNTSSKKESTHLVGNAKSDRVADLLNSLGFDASNFVADHGHIAFNLDWKGSPLKPEMATLNGNVKLKIGRGRIVDIGESNKAKMDIGRVLSILSVQTILRRLSLDFRDLFQKGYSFDSIKGDFVFRDGDAYTNNLLFSSPVASIAVNGRIGLKEKEYDFTLSVTPHVTSSIPVAATILTAFNPIAGIATLAANTVITPAVSQAITHYYEVKGPWSNPVWREIRTRG